MSTEPTSLADLVAQANRVLWAFNLNSSPDRPEGDGLHYCSPADAYLSWIDNAHSSLEEAAQRAFDEIPERIKFRAELVGKSHADAAQELCTVEPEIRRFWAVKSARDLVSNLYEALADEARPQPRVALPKLARVRRG